MILVMIYLANEGEEGYSSSGALFYEGLSEGLLFVWKEYRRWEKDNLEAEKEAWLTQPLRF